METLISQNGRIDRSQRKHGKFLDRERRLFKQLHNGCNGHTADVQNLLITTRYRISQLRGYIPSCTRTKHPELTPNPQRMKGVIYDEKGMMTRYSLGGTSKKKTRDMEAVDEIQKQTAKNAIEEEIYLSLFTEEQVMIDTIHDAVYGLILAEEFVERSDMLWEGDDVLEKRQAGIDLAHVLRPLPEKDPAEYVLDQLNYE